MDPDLVLAVRREREVVRGQAGEVPEPAVRGQAGEVPEPAVRGQAGVGRANRVQLRKLEMQKTSRLVGILSVTLIILFGGYFAVQKLNNYKREQFRSSFTSGRQAFTGGNNGQAVVRFEDAVAKAQTNPEEALAKVNLGVAYLAQDRARGITLLKEISLDESFPSFYRAGAINYVLDQYLTDKDIDFALSAIFVGDIWGSFADGVTKDREGVELALRRAFEWSSSLFSTFTAEYRIGWWYSKQIKSGNAGEKISDYANKIQERIGKGDLAVLQAQRYGGTSRSQFGLAYIVKGLALQGLVTAGAGESDDVVTVYNHAITFLDEDPNDFHARGQVLFARYHLAAFLARENTVQNKQKIIDTLAPIYRITQAPFYTFLRAEADASKFGTDPVRRNIVLLASVDPKFKAKLLELGWKDSDFK